MIRYLLNFRTMTDVAVRTAMLSLAIALLAATANQLAFRQWLPELQAQTSGLAFFSAFAIAMILSVPVMLVFFSTGLEVNRLNHRLVELAEKDHLTGLTNRRKFFELIAASRPESGDAVMRHRGALLIVDIDHFKKINDSHGHQAGDEALIHTARILKRCVRDLDIVARLGGEEFAILLTDADKHVAQEIAERIRVAVHTNPAILQQGSATLSVSIGGVEVWPLQSLAECMRRADLLLYAAKSAGRNRVHFSDLLRFPSYSVLQDPEPRVRINARG